MTRVSETLHSARVARLRLRSWPVHALPAIASAVLLALCYPRIGGWWLSFVALVPLGWAAGRTGRGGRFVVAGGLVFAAWWVVQLRWLGTIGVPSWLGTAAVQAMFTLGAIALLVGLVRRWKLPVALALPLAWVSVDLLRGTIPCGGFGWFALAHTQAAWTDGGSPTWLAQSADLFGEQSVGLLVAAINGAIADACLRGRKATRPLAITALLVVAACGYGYWRVAQTDRLATPGPVIAVIQPNQPLDNRAMPTAEAEMQQWSDLRALTQAAALSNPQPNIIVWPESSVPVSINDESVALHPGYPAPKLFRDQLGAIARRAGVDLLVGASARFDWKPVTDAQGRTFEVPGRQRNSVYHIFADGLFAPTRYDKMHLVPFGEYIPGSHALPLIKTLVLDYFSPWDWDHTLERGEGPQWFALPYTRATGEPAVAQLSPAICFEDVVARQCRRVVNVGAGKADVLINQTNDGWFWSSGKRGAVTDDPAAITDLYAPSPQQTQHLQIATLRSIENRVPTARAVNTGISGFIDSAGRVGPLVALDGRHQLVAGHVSHRVSLDPRTTLYARLGDWPMRLLAGLTLLLGFAALVKPWVLGR